MAFGVLALVLSTSVPASARGSRCLGGKLRAIGQNRSGLLGCSAKGAIRGASAESACVAEVGAKFTRAYNRLSGCVPPAPPDAQCASTVDICRDALRAALPDGEATHPSRCEALRLRAAGRYAAARLACYAKAAARGFPVGTSPGGCLDQAEARFMAAFRRAASHRLGVVASPSGSAARSSSRQMSTVLVHCASGGAGGTQPLSRL